MIVVVYDFPWYSETNGPVSCWTTFNLYESLTYLFRRPTARSRLPVLQFNPRTIINCCGWGFTSVIENTKSLFSRWFTSIMCKTHTQIVRNKHLWIFIHNVSPLSNIVLYVNVIVVAYNNVYVMIRNPNIIVTILILLLLWLRLLLLFWLLLYWLWWWWWCW